jgi:hypothetical protein
VAVRGFLTRRRARSGPTPPPAAVLDGPEQVLATAEELIAVGEFTDAIRLLTDANRARRDQLLEQRLVDLRFDAFRQMEWPADRPEWPESVDDLFPGEHIPEIEPADLTVERVRSAIRNHGSLIVRGLLDPAQIERLRGDIDRALAAYDAAANGETPPELAGWYRPFDRDQMSDRERKRFRGAVMVVESPPTIFDLIETFEAVGVGQLLRDYFGEPPMLLARKGTLRRMSHEGKTGGWHQDGAFMGVDIRSINIWLSLTHCGDDAPGLDVVGRRLDGLVKTGDGAFTDWATSPAAAEEAAAGAIVRPIFEPGDALIFDHLNLHRTAIDPGMVRDRYAIETWLFGPSTYDSMTTTVEDGYSPRDQLPIVF